MFFVSQLNSLKGNLHFSDLSETHKDNSDTSFANGKTEDPDKTVLIPGDSDTDKAAITETKTTSSSSPGSGASSKFIDILPAQMVERVRKEINSKSRELFAECQVEVKKFLSEAPFKDFRMSMYFHRYLQWKYLERQPVTYKTFRMYRVLGKIYSISFVGLVHQIEVFLTISCKGFRKKINHKQLFKFAFPGKFLQTNRNVRDYYYYYYQF